MLTTPTVPRLAGPWGAWLSVGVPVPHPSLPGLPLPGLPAPGLPVPRLPVPGLPGTGLGLPVPWLGSAAAVLQRALAHLVGSAVHDTGGALTRYLLTTPPLLGAPGLRVAWAASWLVTVTLAVPALAVRGAVLSTGRGSRPGGSAAGGGLRGGLLGLALAAGSLPLLAVEATVSDAAAAALLGVTGRHLGPALAGQVAGGLLGDPRGSVLLLVCALLGVALLVELTVLALIRWTALYALAVLGPLALGAGLLPGGDAVARTWWRLQAAVVAVPVLDAAIIAAQAALLHDPADPLVGALGGLGCLVLLTRAPGWLLAQASVPGVREHRGATSALTSAAALGTRAVRALRPDDGPGRQPSPDGRVAGAPGQVRHSWRRPGR